jgi:prolyl-tRNA editing enzyme YbaK/EbsC (Cys-tRNA(Pro) deacylase)
MQPVAKTPADLTRFIADHGISAELVAARHETPTVALAAQAMGCQVEQIIKSVLFLVKNGASPSPALVIANGEMPIDFRRLADLFAVSRKRIRLASAADVLAITGFPAGGVPPFGFEQALPTFVDYAVREWPVVYGGGGDERTLLRLSPDELLRVTSARLVAVR